MYQERTESIKHASYISIWGNVALAALKITFGLIAASLAVVGDGIDSITDIILSVVMLFAALVVEKPPDKEHPYGHRRVEALATKIVSFAIFFAGAQLALTAVRTLISGTDPQLPSQIAMYASIVSIVGKIMLSMALFRVGRTAESAMVMANAKNMANDIIISSAVLIGLIVTQLFGTPIIDTALALGVSIWVMKTAVEIFLDSSIEVMEGVRDPSIYEEIFAAVAAVDGASNPHRTRIRQISNLFVVDLDIEVDPDITVNAAHEIVVEVERTIRERVRNIYDIMVHIEPTGNVESTEKFGLSEADG